MPQIWKMLNTPEKVDDASGRWIKTMGSDIAHSKIHTNKESEEMPYIERDLKPMRRNDEGKDHTIWILKISLLPSVSAADML